MAENQTENVVTETKIPMTTQMYTTEDWWAIWLGGLILIAALFASLAANPNVDSMYEYKAIMEREQEMAGFRTIAYTEAEASFNAVRARNQDGLLKTFHGWLATPARWSSNPLDSLYRSEAAAAEIRAANAQRLERATERLNEARAAAQAAEDLAREANFQNTQLNQEARALLGEWRSARSSHASARSAANTQPFNRIPTLLGLMVVTALLFAIGGKFMNMNLKEYFIGFPIIFGLAVLSYVIANQETVRAYGFSYVLWGIVLGMLISNTVGTPKFLKTAAQTEYFIKTGLVLLGASILVNLILMVGLPGIFVTWVVTPIVLIGTYWFGQNVIKVESKQLNITVSSDMSVSGVSAAIAAAAASRAKKEELTLAIGMSMIFVVVMIFALPAFANWVGMHPVWAGAWLGGTVDNTGSVVAAGELIGPEAMYVAATIKMIQNVMIGVMAFGVAAYWCLKVEPERACAAGAAPMKFTAAGALSEIWYRFPKFILGFIGASIIMTLLAEARGEEWAYAMINNGVLAWANGLRGWFFAIAFVSIGLSISYRELKEPLKGGKALILYVCGQSFNLMLTAFVAYIMFMVLFRDVTDRLMGMGL
ncbi:YeiH family protein [Desulfonatronum thioautotrophicum]|uniref:YeiH family protein n=1 Tax=Desulfonatronum thioautotrophicum TaxID=617001 RepID=UPI0005EB2CBE|nr:putative sulfate exporter family transporter [Desulfonatronum thioautotrophicum]